jgi:aspartate racemase
MEHYVELGGLRTWYGEQGAGDPLVALHPGLVDARAFRANLAVWSARFHSFTPERRGHGHTPDVEGPLTFEQKAADTAAFIETVVGQPTQLLGVSDGAIVALLTAVPRPDLVTRLVAIAGPTHHLLVLCTNTMHKVAAQVQAAVTIPLLDLADVTAEAVLAAGLTTVGLLGTAFTMEQAFYRDRLAAHGLTVLVPDRQDRAAIHAIIYDELCQGIVLDSSRDRYREVIARLTAAGAEGVILGCTEIELLVTQADSPVPVFPTTRLHAQAAVERALAPVGTRQGCAAPSDADPGGVR